MRRTLRYALAISLVPAFLAAGLSRAQPVLTDSLYAAHHPSLLFKPAELPALRARVQDGGRDDEAYTYVRNYVRNIYSVIPPSAVLGPTFGLDAIPNIGLVAHIDEDASVAALGRSVTTYLANTYEPNFDEANSGLRLRSLALGYDLFFADATESQRDLIRDEIVRYIEIMIWNNAYEAFEYRPYLGNHSAMFGAALGLAAIGLQDQAPVDRLVDALAMADRIVVNLLDYQFDPGGSYNEGALYVLWTMRSLIYYFEARERFDGLSYGENARVRAVETWLPYELLPEGGATSHNLNDSPYVTTPFARSTTYLDWATHEWDSGLAKWLWEHSAGTYGVDLGIVADKAATILWHNGVPEAQPDDVLPHSRVWEQRGLYHFRTGWQTGASSSDDVLFNFYSGKFQGGHAQEDQNTFSLYAYGAKFAIDHGSGGLGKESEAHNIVFVDGLGQHNAGSSIGTDGRIAQYLLGGSADYVVGDATAAYSTHSEFNEPGVPFPGIDWSWGYSGANPVASAYRRVLVVHGTGAPPYFVVMDDIEKDGTPHTYQWRLHTHFANTVDVVTNPWTIAGGAAAMDVHLLHPPAQAATVTTSPFENNNGDPNSTLLSVSHTAVDPAFALLLLPHQNTTSPPAVARSEFPGGYACTIDWGDGVVDRFVRNDAGVPIVHEDIQTDALATWLREVDGEVASYLAADVRSLVVGTTEWVTINDGPATCELTGATISLDRDDADFRFFDSGIGKVCFREQSLGFTVVGGFVVPNTSTAVGNTPKPVAWTFTAHPNPFNPSTTLRFDGIGRVAVSVAVYDVAGRVVRRLWNGPLPGDTVAWDGRDESGRAVASGTYFVRAATPSESHAVKVVMLK